MIKSVNKLDMTRKLGYVFVGLLTLSMIALSIIQPFMFGNDDLQAYGSIQPDGRGLPADDKRGAFLVLNEPHSSLYYGDLVELLAVTEAGVVDEHSGAHFLPGEVKSVLVQTAALNENSDYRVYRFNVDEDQKMKYIRDPSGKIMYIENANKVWEPGTYIIDIPSEGMFGGRTYYQFYVDSTIPASPTK